MDAPGGDAGADQLVVCTPRYTLDAKQTPGSVMFVVDMSARMSGAPWAALSAGLIAAVDRGAFDDLSIGLAAFPQSFADPPPCLCQGLGLDLPTCKAAVAPGIACGESTSADVAISDAARQRSTGATGVRRDLKQWLAVNHPLSSTDGSSPGYAAMVAGYAALHAAVPARRALVLVTDGGFNCASYAVASRPGYSDGFCNDWEYPDTVNTLIAQMHLDVAPVETFVVGLPGTHSTGAMQGTFSTAPYSLELALSTYAVSGSPSTVDATCDKGAIFAQTGQPPAHPCHVDLGGSSALDSTLAATALGLARRRALGCVYDVPTLPAGETFDPATTQVSVTLDGVARAVRHRTASTDACAADGCWDVDSGGHVTLLGDACDATVTATAAAVSIVGGCPTN
jgi:hypothetical protein